MVPPNGPWRWMRKKRHTTDTQTAHNQTRRTRGGTLRRSGGVYNHAKRGKGEQNSPPRSGITSLVNPKLYSSRWPSGNWFPSTLGSGTHRTRASTRITQSWCAPYAARVSLLTPVRTVDIQSSDWGPRWDYLDFSVSAVVLAIFRGNALLAGEWIRHLTRSITIPPQFT